MHQGISSFNLLLSFYNVSFLRVHRDTKTCKDWAGRKMLSKVDQLSVSVVYLDKNMHCNCFSYNICVTSFHFLFCFVKLNSSFIC